MALTAEAIATIAKPIARANVRAVLGDDESVNTTDGSAFMRFVDAVVDGVASGVAEALVNPAITQVQVTGSTGVIT